MEDVKNVVRKNLSDGVADNGLTLKGESFLTLKRCVFIQLIITLHEKGGLLEYDLCLDFQTARAELAKQ